MFNRLIGTSLADPHPIDALNFLTYVGLAKKRMDCVKKSLGICMMKYKISDAVVDGPKYALSFLLFPKYSRVRFSLRFTVSLLVSDSPDMTVDVLSSNLKKRNQKGMVFAEMEQQIQAIIGRIGTSRKDWLLVAVDDIAALINNES